MRAVLLSAALLTPSLGLAQTPTNAPTRVQAAAVAPDEVVAPWRATRWGLLGGGLAAGVVGAAVYSLGVSEQSTFDDRLAQRDREGRVTGVSQVEADRIQSNVGDLKTLGAASMITGGVLLAAGLVVWALEPDPPPCVAPAEPEPEPEVRPFSLVPVIGPDGPGFAFGLRF